MAFAFGVGSAAQCVKRSVGVIAGPRLCSSIPMPSVIPWRDGLASFRFPDARKDGPNSTNGLVFKTGSLNFASTGNSQVRTVKLRSSPRRSSEYRTLRFRVLREHVKALLWFDEGLICGHRRLSGLIWFLLCGCDPELQQRDAKTLVDRSFAGPVARVSRLPESKLPSADYVGTRYSFQAEETWYYALPIDEASYCCGSDRLDV